MLEKQLLDRSYKAIRTLQIYNLFYLKKMLDLFDGKMLRWFRQIEIEKLLHRISLVTSGYMRVYLTFGNKDTI